MRPGNRLRSPRQGFAVTTATTAFGGDERLLPRRFVFVDTALQRHRPRERDRPGADRQLAAFGLSEDTYLRLWVIQGAVGERGVIPLGVMMAGRQCRRGNTERDRRRHERHPHGGPD